MEGVRVLDLTQVQAGPSCTQLLAWLGAEVIKIEEPGVGDRTRNELAHAPDVDSFYFLLFNANKRSLCLDLKSDEGRNIFGRLVEVSDVVVENFGPGGMDKFDLGYERLRLINPGLVYASVKGFGTYGPYAGFKAFESIAQAMSGAMSTNGEMGRPPLILPAGVADSGSGLHCAIGILAALRQRDKTGAGDYLEVSMQDTTVNLMRIRMIETLATNVPLPRDGNRWWDLPPLVYRCHPGGADDYVVLYIGGEVWDSLLAVMGRSDLIGDERFATRDARSQHVDEVEAIVAAWTGSLTKRQVMETLNGIGLPCGAVLSTTEVLEDPHLRARDMVIQVSDPKRGEYLALGCPIKLKSHEATFSPPPLLSEHSEEVLSTLLGIDEQGLQALKDAGVI